MLNERQRVALDKELLQADLGRLAGEAAVTTIRRELTRALVERPFAGPEDVVGWVVGCLDKVVVAWSRPTARIDDHVVDGVRAAARIVAEAAERAGLTMPVQPATEQPGIVADVDPATAEEVREETLLAGKGWAPADGGSTPSMFGEVERP